MAKAQKSEGQSTKSLHVATFTVAGEGSKNFVKAPMDGGKPSGTMPLLVSNDGQLYVSKALGNGHTKFRVTLEALD